MRLHLKILASARRHHVGVDGVPVYDETLDQAASRLVGEAAAGRQHLEERAMLLDELRRTRAELGLLHRDIFLRGALVGGAMVLVAAVVAAAVRAAL